MLKNFLQTKKHLYSLIPSLQEEQFPGERGLRRMQDLLDRLANPEKKFISIHVAGTAGKGSTSYLIAKIMEESGLKVGLSISPHLQTMRERLVINSELISEKDFISLINQIRLITEEMKRGKYGKPSYFEVLLAAAFLYFAQQKVDLAVIEAGMGGRYDGTNVLKAKIAVVTNIGLDHTQVLGKTKSKILKDKMQIIKPSCQLAMTGIKQNYLRKIIKDHCQQQRVPLYTLNQDFHIYNSLLAKNYSKFSFNFGSEKIKNIKLNLAGAYQLDNVSLALATCLKLAEVTKFKLSKRQIRQALRKAFFPGRMEVVSQKPLIILDGAHNEDKIKALVYSIRQIYPQQKFIIIFGVKKDKEVRKMLLLLKKISCNFVLTQFGKATDLGFQLHYPVKEVYKIAKKIMPQAILELVQASDKALKMAKEKAKKEKAAILLTGSLYLVGEARQYLKLKPNFSRKIDKSVSS